MFPELTGKKVFTEDGKEIGYISEIKPDEFGSFVAIINTKYSEFPRFEVPVTMLRKKTIGGLEAYIVRTIPFKLKMLMDSEIAAESVEVEEEKPLIEIPEAPEVPPLEQFVQKKENVLEETKEEEQELLKEEEKIEKEIVEEKPEEIYEKKGIFSRILELIVSVFKKLFKKG